MTDITLSAAATKKWNWIFGLSLSAIVIAGFALRAWSKDTAYGVFVDEVLYGGLAQSAQTAGIVPITLFNQAFFLHPPLVFLVGSFFVHGFSTIGQNDILALVDQVRWVNIFFGAVTAALAGLVVRFALRSHIKQASISGMLVAALLAVDPFITRENGRFMLETVTVATALIGYTILLPALNRGKLTWPVLISSGLLLGASVLGKDMMVVAIALPIIAAGIWKLGGISRGRWATLLGFSAVPYLAYLIYIAQTQYWSQWIADKISGIRRAAGIDQITGFHAEGAPNLIDKIVNQFSTFWPTYLLLILAVPATIYLLIKGTAGERLVALFTAGPAALLAYDLLVGTLEEQFLYYLLVPAAISVLIATDILIFSKHSHRVTVERLIGALVVLAVIVTPSVITQVQIRTNPDDAYQRAIAYMNQIRQPGDVVAWAEGKTNYTLAQFFFLNEPETAGPWGSPENLTKHNVKYVLTNSKEISEGYTYLSPDYLSTLEQYATPVFTDESRWNGTVQIWRVNQ